ncbi:ABC transporter permease [Agarivorans sp. QJM3NY_29]|uniref:ABC transporter permease n=1 Tax=unclassified Agarivorans TaxID=2636026 RepID=UPI003D7D8C81
MRLLDAIGYALAALLRQRLRAVMLLAAIAISVGSVVMMTALGQGARNFVEQEFSFLGKDVLIILPGRKETTGGMPPVTGTSLRDLTLADMAHIQRRIPHLRVAPLVLGASEVKFASRNRQSMILGSTAEIFATHRLRLLRGKTLPDIPLESARPVCVLGATLAQELFAQANPLGQWIRLDNRRFRVIGTFTSESSNMGLKFDETVLIPVASAQSLFNAPGLYRLFVQTLTPQDLAAQGSLLLQVIAERHQGVADVTLLRPDSLLATFNEILFTLTLAVTGIGAISLIVAGIMMMNIMLISTHQRCAEIGLLKALGASNGTVRSLFLCEAMLLSLGGGIVGLLVGYSAVVLLSWYYPDFPVQVPLWASASALLSAVVIGLLFALLPANQAARQKPVESLKGSHQ